MEARLIALTEQHGRDNGAMAVIKRSREQIELYRRFAPFYGYVFYILRVRAR